MVQVTVVNRERIKGLLKALSVREQADGAMNELVKVGKGAVPYLTDVVENDEPMNRAFAGLVLARIASNDDTVKPEIVAALAKSLQGNNNSFSCESLIDSFISTVGFKEAVIALADVGETKIIIDLLNRKILQETCSFVEHEELFKLAVCVVEKVGGEKSLPLMPVLIRALKMNAEDKRNKSIYSDISAMVKLISRDKPTEVTEAFLKYYKV